MTINAGADRAGCPENVDVRFVVQRGQSTSFSGRDDVRCRLVYGREEAVAIVVVPSGQFDGQLGIENISRIKGVKESGKDIVPFLEERSSFRIEKSDRAVDIDLRSVLFNLREIRV